MSLGAGDPHQALAADGPLARRLEGFRPRPAQQEMAAAVAEALETGGTLVAEAGTGTGKTFAYLAPALLSGRKVLISTGTRNLQDQLYHRDLPLLRDALGLPLRVALLKGRANYLCLHRLELTWQRRGKLPPGMADEVGRLRQWAATTRSGERADYPHAGEDDPVWPRVTATSDTCLGSDCDVYDDCFLVRARRAAQEADCVVVNHHLFCADLALKSEGVADLLPRADAVVFDEAHQLPDAAGRFFGESLSTHAVSELVRDLRAEMAADARESLSDAERVGSELEMAGEALRQALGGDNERREAWAAVAESQAVTAAVNRLGAALDWLAELLTIHAERSRGLGRLLERAREARARLDHLTTAQDAESVFWFEARARGATLHATPLEVAGPFQQATGGGEGQAWVFTSATLAVNGGFEHFRSRLGLPEDVDAHQWPSPFDYARQAVLYLPEGLPEPRDPEHTNALIDATEPVLATVAGGAFFLFTSHRALQRAAERLRRECERPLLVQGDAPRDRLIQHFRELGNAVLLGTGSFWEGVDVRGDALSLVVIDKLPFPSPADPVIEARDRHLKDQGYHPFPTEHLPTAVLALKQGAGRLIRDDSDAGVLVLGDSRLRVKGYGATFLNSLPPMPRTSDITEMEGFLTGTVGGESTWQW